MAPATPITLPPSFFNSFWSPDYRTGLDTLFRQLETGTIQNNEVADFISVSCSCSGFPLARVSRCSSLPPSFNTGQGLYINADHVPQAQGYEMC